MVPDPPAPVAMSGAERPPLHDEITAKLGEISVALAMARARRIELEKILDAAIRDLRDQATPELPTWLLKRMETEAFEAAQDMARAVAATRSISGYLEIAELRRAA